MSALSDIEPAGFVRAFIERHGGIAEAIAEGRLEVVLPPSLAAALGMPEMAPALEARLGSPLLERVVAEARRGTTVARASIEGLRIKSDGVAGLVESRLAAGNARLRAGDVARVRTATLLVALRYEAVSDEARGGVVEAAVDLVDLTSVPDLRTRLSEVTLGPARAEPVATAPLAKVAGAIVRLAAPAIERDARPFLESMDRRLRRDEGRVHGYYDDLLRELEAPRSPRFRRLEPEEAARRRASERRAIEAERDRRLADAARQYAVRLDVGVAAAIRLEHDEVACRLAIRRRARERVVRAGWSPLTRDVKPLICERCLGETRSFDVCDDALHIICPACAAKRCLVCARPARG